MQGMDYTRTLMKKTSNPPGALLTRLLLLLCLCIVYPPPHLSADDMDQYRVKSAFIFNFALLSQWPDTAPPSAEIRVFVVGNDSLRGYFKSIDGKRIGERVLRVHFPLPNEEFTDPHMLFISEEVDTKTTLRLLLETRGKSVITIGERSAFNKLGGMIRFFVENNRLKFEINLAAAQKEGIRFSSRLLKIATITEAQ